MHGFRRDLQAAFGPGALISLMLLASAPPLRSLTEAPTTAPASPASVLPAVPRSLASGAKPDWHGSDLGNTGVISAPGPSITPTLVFTAAPSRSGQVNGIEVDAGGNIVFANSLGSVYSYRSDGTQNWQFSAGNSRFNTDLNGAPGAAPVVSSDGAVYIAAANGNVFQIDNTTGSTAGQGQSIYTLASSSSGFQQTPKIGPDNSMYIGSTSGAFYRLAPPSLVGGAAGAQATVTYAFTATGSTQTDGIYAGVASQGPFRIYGQAALDAAGNAYFTSSDANPQLTTGARLGTLYKVSPAGTQLYAVPLRGDTLGAVVLAPNPANPGQTLVVVADRYPAVTAFDAATGQMVWRFVPTSPTPNDTEPGPFIGSPVVSNGNVYVADSAGYFFGLDLRTGQSLGGNFPVSLPAGTRASPIVDANGNIFFPGSTARLYAYSPAGVALWSVRTAGTASVNYVPAIGAANAGQQSGMVYAGSNIGIVTGYRFDAFAATATAGAGQTATAAAQQTAVASQTNAAGTATAAAQQTAVASQTNAAGTAMAAAQQTATAAAFATAQPTAFGQTATAAAQQTAVASQTNAAGTATAAAQQTATAVSAQTATAVSAQTATAAAQQTSVANTATVAAQQTSIANTATAAAQQTATAVSAQTATAAAQQTATAASLQTAAPSLTAAALTPSPTPGPGTSDWPKFRYDMHNDGDFPAQLLTTVPRQVWDVDMTSGRHGLLFTSPALAPDGTIYQVDDIGELKAIRPSDGSTVWTSQPVLGKSSTLSDASGQRGTTIRNLGSSPAVASDGSIYAGSTDGGIYRFNPADGTASQVFAQGKFLGSSIAIGPAGVLYVGSVDGIVYAIGRDGSQRYATAVPCPGGLTPSIQSSPALDRQGNLYIGYGCGTSPGNPPQGGVIKLDPSGNVVWNYRGGGSEVPGGAVGGAIVLSPDESRVYAAESVLGQLYGLSAANGTLVWPRPFQIPEASGNFEPGLFHGSSPALSPDGNHVYIADNNANLYEISAADGSTEHVGTQGSGVTVSASPAVDQNGTIFLCTWARDIRAYDPQTNLIYSQPAGGVNSSSNKPQTVIGGGVVASNGVIYLTNSVGELIAMQSGTVSAPTRTPIPHTPIAGGTAPPAPTDTPQGDITAYTPTSTPIGGVRATATTNATTLAGGATKTAQAGTPGPGTPGPGAPGPGTPGPGTPGPGSKSTPVVAQVGPIQISVDGGVLTPGDLVRFVLKGPNGSKAALLVRVSFDTPTPIPTRILVKKKTGKVTSRGIRPHAVGQATRADAVRMLAPFARNDAGRAKATATPRPGAKGSATPRPTVKGKQPTGKGKPPVKAPSCIVVGTIRDRGTFRFTRTIGKSNVDTSCLRVVSFPARAVALRLIVTAQVTYQGHGFKSVTLKPVLVRRPQKPSQQPQVRLILPTLVQASVVLGAVTSGANETVRSFTARGARVRYVITYAGGNQTRTINRVADATGHDTFSFRVGYLPLRSVGVSAAQIKVDATQGKRRARTLVVHFDVRRPDVILRLRVVRARVSLATVRTGTMEQIDTAAARGAGIAYVIDYANGPTARYTATADGSGYATLRFHVQYLPPKGKRVLASVRVVATQGRVQARTTARFYVQG